MSFDGGQAGRPLRVLHHGEFAEGGNAAQRARAFDARSDIVRLEHPMRPAGEPAAGLSARLRRRLRYPADVWAENARLIRAAEGFKPDMVLVENSHVLTRQTLRGLKAQGCRLAFLSSDDITAKHNLSLQLQASLPDWDVVFTTKRFNVPELEMVGVKRTVLMSNMYDPIEHRPLQRNELGDSFEAYDLVFAGTYEADRCDAINALAEAGHRVLVRGSAAGLLAGSWGRRLHSSIDFGPEAVGPDYARTLHAGKIALGFLRKMNRDQITTRSIEIPACGRCMLAEKSPEHDAHFREGVEYVSFRNTYELVSRADELLADDVRRHAVAAAGCRRVSESAWAVSDFVEKLVQTFRGLKADRT